MNTFEIKLSVIDLGQVLDAIDLRTDAWEATAQVMRGERTDVLIEECNDADEAEKLAAHYRRIAEDVRAQAGW